MTTYRKVYTKILESKDIRNMPDDFTRLTWTYLILIVDREGRALDDLVYLRCKLYPRREDVTTAMVSSAMSWFADHGMIRRYGVKDECYFYIVNFVKYQGDTRRESASIYPPEEDSAACVSTQPTLPQQGEGDRNAFTPPAPASTREPEQTEPDSGVTQNLLVTKSCPDSYSDSDSNSDPDSDSDSDADAEVKTTACADAGPESPGSPGDQQRRLYALKHKVRTIFGDSPLYQSLFMDTCNKYGLDELDLALNEAILQGYNKWKNIIDILRKRARANPQSTGPPVT